MSRRWIVLIAIGFLLTAIHPILSNASVYRDEERGIFFDPLDDSSHMDDSLSKGYTILDDGYVTVDMGITKFVYDFNSTSKNVAGFYKNYARPSIILNIPGSLTILSTIEKKISNTDPLKRKDGACIKGLGNFFNLSVPLQHYKFKIEQNPKNISALVLNWSGSFSGCKLRVYVWDCKNKEWKQPCEIEHESARIAIGLSDLSNFVDDGWINIVLAPKIYLDEEICLCTDYISLEVIKISRKNATIVTNPIPIENTTIGWWEYIEWYGEANAGTIRVQILDGDGNLVGDDILEGNSEGFEDNIIPLYMLTERKIRLKFYLEVENPVSPPLLDEYLILWQTSEGKWKDDLSTDYRLEEKEEDHIVSKIIYLPVGYWWDEFTAKVNLSGGGKVTFNVLDEENKVIVKGIEGKTSTTYNISGICKGAIKLEAIIEKNDSFIPKIEEWGITFSRESTKPELKYPSIIYVRKDDVADGCTDIEIEAKDSFPGICKEFAWYKLEYIENSSGSKHYTVWLPAEVEGDDCSRDWVKIRAEDIPIFYDDSLKDLLNLKSKVNLSLQSIRFKVGDMSGITVESEWIDVEIDVTPPESHIVTTVDDLGFLHGCEKIEITAEATDDISNVKNVTLYYRVSKDNESFSDPIAYSSLEKPPWKWTFNASESGYYKFFTIAIDNAGNIEGMKEGELLLLIDVEAPEKPEFEEKIYWLNNSKIDFVTFSDDLRIKSIEYRIADEGYFEWQEIAKDIDSNVYSEGWEINEWDWSQMEDGRVYHIYFRIRDMVGNEYVTESDTDALKVVKDTLPPSAAIESINVWQSRTPVKINTYVSSQDEGEISKVILFYRYSRDNKSWSEWKEYSNCTSSGWYTWSFSPEEGDGYYEIKLRAYDSAGNFHDSNIINFGITVFPREEMVLMVVMFIIFLVVSVIISRRWD